MAKKCQISEGSDGDESQSDRKRRLTDEYELGLKYMRSEDARVISKFLSSHPGEITTRFPIRRDSEVISDSYAFNLVPILRILQNHQFLDIIDKKRSIVLNLIFNLRGVFKGPWIDSLESFLVENAKNDYVSRRELRRMKRDLLDDVKCLRFKVKDYRRFLNVELPCEFLECIRRVLKTDFPSEEDIDTIPASEIIPACIKYYRRKLKHAKTELALVIEKRKALKDARKSLKFFYQV